MEEPLPPRKKRRLSLSRTKMKKTEDKLEEDKDNHDASGSGRFSTSSLEELHSSSNKFVPKNTEVSLNWAFRIYCEWIDHCKGASDREAFQVEDLWQTRDPEHLCVMLSRFCLEVKQRNGSPYTPKSILQILSNLQKTAMSRDIGALRFMDQKDARFSGLQNVLSNMSRKLHKDGVGASKAQARVILVEEELQLWDKGMIGIDSPQMLLNGVFFYCGMHLCLRGGEEHRGLKYSQFCIKTVPNPSQPTEVIQCLVYTEHGSKNRPGTMHHVHLANKEVVHYANPLLGNRCFVSLMELYMSKLSITAIANDLFYCKPARDFHEKPWYTNSPVGHNTLGRKLKDMFVGAGLDATGISNHSLRATGVTRLYDNGVAEKLIMERSGHLSVSGVRSYERTLVEQQQMVSNTLSSLLPPQNKLLPYLIKQ